MRFRRQLQAARGDGRQRFDLTDHRGKDAAAQRFLHRPQRVARLARAGDDEPCRIESAGGQAGAIKRADFAQGRARRAPQDTAASASEQSGKRGDKAARCRIAFDLVQAGARQRRQDTQRQQARARAFHGEREAGLQRGKLGPLHHESLSAQSCCSRIVLLIPIRRGAVKP